MIKNRLDFVSGSVLFMFGVFVILLSYSHGLGKPSEAGPGQFGFVLGIILAILSSMICLNTIVEKSQTEKKTFEVGPRWKNVILQAILIFVFAMALDTLGFLISSFVLFALSLRFIFLKGFLTGIVWAFICSFGSYILFNVILKTDLPRGICPF
jgi:putative tricarboxylic transport membrane protein